MLGVFIERASTSIQDVSMLCPEQFCFGFIVYNIIYVRLYINILFCITHHTFVAL